MFLLQSTWMSQLWILVLEQWHPNYRMTYRHVRYALWWFLMKNCIFLPVYHRFIDIRHLSKSKPCKLEPLGNFSFLKVEMLFHFKIISDILPLSIRGAVHAWKNGCWEFLAYSSMVSYIYRFLLTAKYQIDTCVSMTKYKWQK